MKVEKKGRYNSEAAKLASLCIPAALMQHRDLFNLPDQQGDIRQMPLRTLR